MVLPLLSASTRPASRKTAKQNQLSRRCQESPCENEEDMIKKAITDEVFRMVDARYRLATALAASLLSW